jgi:isocitrate dehydrogenase (NAD+)
MRHKITFIPGDGIGPEVSWAARRCIEAAGVEIDWELAIAGEEAQNKFGNPLPKETIESIKRNRIALKGPLITPIAGGFRSVNVQLRQLFNLFACLRPIKSYPGVKSLYKDIDIIIIRENTEDLYAGIEFERGKSETTKLISLIEDLTEIKIKKDSGLSIKPISKSASRRIVDFAFQYAIDFNRKKVSYR